MRLVPTYTPDPDYIDRQLDAEIAALRSAAGHRTVRHLPTVRNPRPGSTPPAS